MAYIKTITAILLTCVLIQGTLGGITYLRRAKRIAEIEEEMEKELGIKIDL